MRDEERRVNHLQQILSFHLLPLFSEMVIYYVFVCVSAMHACVCLCVHLVYQSQLHCHILDLVRGTSRPVKLRV